MLTSNLLRSFAWLALSYFSQQILSPNCAHAQLTIDAINVGEGDSTLVQFNDESLLVDAGSPMGGALVVKYLRANKIAALKSVIITHPHPDHFAGIFAVLGLVSVGLIYDNGQSVTDIAKREDLFRWYTETVRAHKGYTVLAQGDVLKMGTKNDLVELEVLWPPKNEPLNSDWNNNSLVIKISNGKFCALLMGDALASTEQALLKFYGSKLQCSVLKAGHHGSAETATPEFLKAVNPKLVLVSVNAANIRGYPAAKTLARYAAHAKVLVTSDAGNITVNANSDGSFSTHTQFRKPK